MNYVVFWLIISPFTARMSTWVIPRLFIKRLMGKVLLVFVGRQGFWILMRPKSR